MSGKFTEVANAIMLRPANTLAQKLEQQRDLFRHFGVSEGMMERYEIVQRDGAYKLVQREEAIKILDWDLEGHSASVARSQKSYADRIGLNAPMRGKFNDAGRLEVGGDHFNDVQAVEIGEVGAVGSACS